MGTSIDRASALTNLSQRGASFDISGEQVDGMDVRAVKAAGEKAVAHAREGNGPYILEMLTYRYRGHSMSDPAKYRSREEVERMRPGARSHRAGAGAADRERARPRRRSQGHRQGDPRHSERGCGLRAARPGAGCGGAVYRRAAIAARLAIRWAASVNRQENRGQRLITFWRSSRASCCGVPLRGQLMFSARGC